MKLDIQDRLLELAAAVRPLPRTVIELADLVASADASIDGVTAVVKSDQSLAAAVLREANSAAASSTRVIAALDQAVMRLGMGRVLAAAIRSSVGTIPDQHLVPYRLTGDLLWDHANCASRIAEVVQRKSSLDLGSEVATSALLHDIGKIVLGQVFEPEQLRAASEHQEPLEEVERELVGVDHAEMGGLLLEMWNLPAEICVAVRFHHRPDDTTFAGARALWLASQLAHSYEGLGDGDQPEPTAELIDGFERLGVPPSLALAEIERLVARAKSGSC